MKKLRSGNGFTLIEVIVSVALFAIFVLGVYGSWQMIYRIVYKSRTNILTTALLDERLEVARNLPYDKVGTVNGAPNGVIPATTTVERNGAQFYVTTVVRSIDDPYDSVLGGTPNDTAPADYKLVQVTVKCISCQYAVTSEGSTIVSPKDLEGDTNNGAIFVLVTDSHSNPIKGASVHIENTKLSPPVVIDDVTDETGYLKIVDTPTSTDGYAVTVTMPGYSTDGTTASSTQNPSPTKPFLTVSKQLITEVFYSIDLLGRMALHTLDESCGAVPNTAFNIQGDKLKGEPNIHKYSQNVSTDGTGNLDITNMEFDTYSFNFGSSGYDMAGSLPMTPFQLVAGNSADLSFVLVPHTQHSLLTRVVDDASGLPISDANVILKKNGTTVGHQMTNFSNLSQTDWSGGSGVDDYSDTTETSYFSGFQVDTAISPGNIQLATFNGSYLTDGVLESSTFDIGKKVDFKTVTFTSELWPAEAGDRALLIQLAMSNSSTPSALTNFVGPDGTAASYYSTTSTVVSTGGQGYRFFRYRVYLHTNDTTVTPVFSNFALTFTNGCTPPGQVFFSNMTSSTYSIEVSASGYNTSTVSVDVNGTSSSTVSMVKSL